MGAKTAYGQSSSAIDLCVEAVGDVSVALIPTPTTSTVAGSSDMERFTLEQSEKIASAASASGRSCGVSQGSEGSKPALLIVNLGAGTANQSCPSFSSLLPRRLSGPICGLRRMVPFSSAADES